MVAVAKPKVKAKVNVKALNPRSPDTTYVGDEPQWLVQPSEDSRLSAMARAFNWYNYFYSKKEAKEMIAVYLDANDRSKDAKRIRTVPDSQIRLTTGWLCRMSTVGLELTQKEQLKLNSLIAESLSKPQEEKLVEPTVETPKGPTIQDRLREKVSECAGEIEGLYDNFLQAGAKMSQQFQPIAVIRGKNVAPQLIHVISQCWKAKLSELEEAVAGKDAQLSEGYRNYTKTQLKQMVKFAEQVINDCGNYVQIKKVERKPRAKKAVSPEKLTARFKYLKTFEQFKLVSEPAVKLVGASEAWLYDTKKRKLIHVVGDSHGGTFTVKGSSIVGFDTGSSTQKILRKPAEQLKALLGSGKPAARKLFKEIKATETQFNGRGNENVVILKAW